MNCFKKLFVVGMATLAVLLTGCGGGKGEPPEVMIDGVSLVVGESVPGDLTNQGFELNDLGAMIFELHERSSVSSIFLEKDGVSYGSLTLTNESRESKFVGSCLIEEIKFYSLNETNTDINITINGVNPVGMTLDELKAAYPDLEVDENSDSDYFFHYLRNGKYTICFHYTKDVMTDIDVQHEFSKGY